MKTERRHELETNQLADSLAQGIDRVQPYLRTILGLVIALLVLIFAYVFVSRHSAAKAREGWEEYFQALNQLNRDQIAEVAEKHPNTPAAWWATAVMADLELNEGTDMLFKDKAVARDKLRSAVDHYQEVIEGARQPALLQRVTFGQARAYESLGELDLARKSYQSIHDNWPDSPFVTAAQQQAKKLESSDTKEFYDWFAKQEPGKTMAKEPGVPGLKLPFDLDSVEPPKDSTQGPSLPGGSAGDSAAEQSP